MESRRFSLRARLRSSARTTHGKIRVFRPNIAVHPQTDSVALRHEKNMHLALHFLLQSVWPAHILLLSQSIRDNRTMPFDGTYIDNDVDTIRALLLRGDASGVVLYRGPSAINGAPIVVVATAWGGSANSKTGNMVQTYIIADGMHPVEAAQTGADAAVCGACAHRPALFKTAGAARCYVNLAFGANSVAHGLMSGAYIDATWMSASDLAQLGADLAIRIGTYGDGAAAPFAIWRAFTSRARTWTGYSHQWRAFPAFAALCMASVDSEAEAEEAHAMGWRTFRVADPVTWAKMSGEGLCPASYEAGKRTTCVDCGLCSGTAGKGRASIMIPDHSSAGNAAKRRAGIMPPRVVIRRTPAAA